MHQVTSGEQQAQAIRLKQMYSRHQRSRDLIAVGAYAAGSDPQLDRAITLFPRVEQFLRQPLAEQADPAASRNALAALVSA
jgi:flagellum-specific ATP synthase